MEALVSVIVPVYNVEKYFKRCLESVINQTYHNLEIILVDDGSPDHCPEMCDSWAQKDERIRVIHQNNGGLSDARNVGIDASRGEWLTFVDSDDYIEEGTLEQVMAATADNDLVEYPVERFCGSPQESLLTFEPKVYKDMSDYWLNGQAYEHSYVWNKIYRKELFNQIRFPKGQVFEDIQTLPLLLQKAHRVATIPHGLYHYCWNESGITATANGQALESLLKAHLQTPWMDDRNQGIENPRKDESLTAQNRRSEGGVPTFLHITQNHSRVKIEEDVLPLPMPMQREIAKHPHSTYDFASERSGMSLPKQASQHVPRQIIQLILHA